MGRPEFHEAANRDPARRWAWAGGLVAASAALLLLGTAAIPPAVQGAAWAESHEDGGHEDGGADEGHEDGGHSGGSGRGKGGSHDDGHDDASHDDAEGGHESGGKGGRGGSKGGGHEDGAEGGHEGGGGEGRGGPGGGGEGDGGGRGQGAGAGGAGRPVWAQEGIPEVELGRLNVARSPDHVLDRAYAEALATFSEDVAAFYRLDLAAMERELATNWGNIRLIDSPLQNLALLRDALDGRSVLRDVGITTDNDTLLAVFLGTASDKSMPVTTDTALAISAILGRPLDQTEAAALAEEAERIRQAILEGHG
jgi:hypothetical protein